MKFNKSLLIVSTNADLSGAPKHVLDLAEGLAISGVKANFIFGELGVVSEKCKLLNHNVQICTWIRSSINPFVDILGLFYIVKFINKNNIDIIHAHSTKAGMLCRIAAYIKKIPVIYTIHGWGYGPGRRPKVSAIVKIVEKYLVTFTDQYIAVSNHDRCVGMVELNIPSDKIVTIHNGVSDVERNTNIHKVWDCIMVARNDPQKDYATLFKALSITPFKLAVAGRGTDSESFKQNALKYSGDNYGLISFLGLREDIDLLLEKSRIFILSSKFEGLPLSVIEAMRSSMPIIASNVGGLVELVDNSNGVLVEPSNPIQLASAISNYIESPLLQKIHSTNSRKKYVLHFHRDQMLKNTFAVYRIISLH